VGSKRATGASAAPCIATVRNVPTPALKRRSVVGRQKPVCQYGVPVCCTRRIRHRDATRGSISRFDHLAADVMVAGTGGVVGGGHAASSISPACGVVGLRVVCLIAVVLTSTLSPALSSSACSPSSRTPLSCLPPSPFYACLDLQRAGSSFPASHRPRGLCRRCLRRCQRLHRRARSALAWDRTVGGRLETCRADGAACRRRGHARSPPRADRLRRSLSARLHVPSEPAHLDSACSVRARAPKFGLYAAATCITAHGTLERSSCPRVGIACRRSEPHAAR